MLSSANCHCSKLRVNALIIYMKISAHKTFPPNMELDINSNVTKFILFVFATHTHLSRYSLTAND